MRPHRWQPTMLPRPWDSQGKNTGVGYHFLLQCMKVKSESEVAQPCPTLSNPMDCSPPGSSIHGIFQARVPEWGAIAFSDSDIGEWIYLLLQNRLFLTYNSELRGIEWCIGKECWIWFNSWFSSANEGGKIRWDYEVCNVYHFISEVMLKSAFEICCLFCFIYKI